MSSISRRSTFIEQGQWYKGNLHCHTTMSDGSRSPEETARLYKDKGYSFLSISDHNIYQHFSEFNTDTFLMLPGVERDVNVTGEVMKCFHIVGVGTHSHNASAFTHGQRLNYREWKSIETAKRIAEELNDHAMMPILAHPVWSRNELSDLLALKGIVGIEIYNNVCEVEWHFGHAQLYWDLMLKRGHRVWGFATDDCHNTDAHAFGGWIVVKAPALTVEAIAQSIKQGSFYSSSGPEIHDFYVEDGRAFVQCSPASAIHFVTYDNLGRSIRGCDLTEAEHRLSGQETYVRVEVVDSEGRTAWSNPIFLNP